jgi:hypothetical protein
LHIKDLEFSNKISSLAKKQLEYEEETISSDQSVIRESVLESFIYFLFTRKHKKQQMKKKKWIMFIFN